jgi:hypothetical protein
MTTFSGYRGFLGNRDYPLKKDHTVILPHSKNKTPVGGDTTSFPFQSFSAALPSRKKDFHFYP